MTMILYVLDVDDFRPLAEVASKQAHVSVRKRGPYYEVSASETFEIDRNATGCRNAVWYSSVAAIHNGRVAVWDRDVLRIEPSASSSFEPQVTDVE